MKIKTFKRGYRNGWEINFFIGNISIRIGRYQFGIWKNYNPIINNLLGNHKSNDFNDGTGTINIKGETGFTDH